MKKSAPKNTTMININKLCRVCGYYYSKFYPWGENGDSPSYGICSCCGVEFGNEDDDIQGIRIERRRWIDAGMPWYRAKDEKAILYEPPPPDYNPKEQLKNIPPEWL